jgi:hypothetical protein
MKASDNQHIISITLLILTVATIPIFLDVIKSTYWGIILLVATLTMAIIYATISNIEIILNRITYEGVRSRLEKRITQVQFVIFLLLSFFFWELFIEIVLNINSLMQGIPSSLKLILDVGLRALYPVVLAIMAVLVMLERNELKSIQVKISPSDLLRISGNLAFTQVLNIVIFNDGEKEKTGIELRVSFPTEVDFWVDNTRDKDRRILGEKDFKDLRVGAHSSLGVKFIPQYREGEEITSGIVRIRVDGKKFSYEKIIRTEMDSPAMNSDENVEPYQSDNEENYFDSTDE